MLSGIVTSVTLADWNSMPVSRNLLVMISIKGPVAVPRSIFTRPTVYRRASLRSPSSQAALSSSSARAQPMRKINASGWVILKFKIASIFTITLSRVGTSATGQLYVKACLDTRCDTR